MTRLAALTKLGEQGFIPEFEQAVRMTLWRPPVGLDHLCCGTMGRVEFLLRRGNHDDFESVSVILYVLACDVRERLGADEGQEAGLRSADVAKIFALNLHALNFRSGAQPIKDHCGVAFGGRHRRFEVLAEQLARELGEFDAGAGFKPAPATLCGSLIYLFDDHSLIIVISHRIEASGNG
jgi:hypothetical protein